jgi:hypothetical protein
MKIETRMDSHQKKLDKIPNHSGGCVIGFCNIGCLDEGSDFAKLSSS